MKKKPVRKKDAPEFNILKRIINEREKRGWTDYALAAASGMSQSTLSTWYSKNMQPSVASLEKICNGLGISLAQFFSDEDIESGFTREQREIFALWSGLSPRQRMALRELLVAMQYSE